MLSESYHIKHKFIIKKLCTIYLVKYLLNFRPNRQMMIKTISKKEAYFLMDIMPK